MLSRTFLAVLFIFLALATDAPVLAQRSHCTQREAGLSAVHQRISRKVMLRMLGQAEARYGKLYKYYLELVPIDPVQANQLRKRLDRILDRITALEHKLYCYPDNTTLRVLIENNSVLQLDVFMEKSDWGPLKIGTVKAEAELEIQIKASAFQNSIRKNYFIFAASFAGQPVQDKNIKSEVARAFQIEYPKKTPCLSTLRYRFFNRSFTKNGSNIISPPAQPHSVALLKLSYPPTMINNGAGQDLTISYGGNPAWPVTAKIFPVDCPSGVDCGSYTYTFQSGSSSGTLVWKGILWCRGFAKTTALVNGLYLTDAKGNRSQTGLISNTCVVP